MIASSLIAFLSLAPNWAVGNHLQLTWGGSDYVPVGLQVEAGSKEIAAGQAAGIKDYNVEVSAAGQWKDVAAQMGDSRYFFTVTSALPSARGTIVQPQYYRLNNIKASQTITCNLPGADRAFVVVALSRDGTVISSKFADVTKGVLKTDVKAATDAEQVALIYPVGESLMMEDLWDRLDERRDQILRQVRTMGSQPGLRGIINPLGSTPYLASRDNGFVPSSPLFVAEFADYLSNKYRNVDTLMRAWYMQAPNIANFTEAAQLFPLWNGARGVKYFYDPVHASTIPADPRKSQFWSDLAESISKTRIRRVHRIIRSIRKAAGVPVFQDWAGWSWFFENPENQLTGLTIRLNKFNPSALLDSLSGAMSSNLRSVAPGPVFAIDVPYSPDLDQPSVLEDLNVYGIRGLFVRATKDADYAKIAKLSLGATQMRPDAIYFPVNASNPAYAQKLAGNLLWLPSPADGNRLDLGPDISGYQMSDGQNITYVLWTNGPRTTVDFRLANPTTAQIKGLIGLPPVVSVTKTGLRIEFDHSPIFITGAAGCPVPESEFVRLEREIGNLIGIAASQHKDTSIETVDYRAYRELIDSQPDKAYAVAKRVEHSLNNMLTGMIWAEFETSGDHTFSEVIEDAGCSNGAYLTVRTPLASATGLVQATLNVPQRTTGNLEVWVAAKIPNLDDRQKLKLKIGGQTMSFTAPPLSPYGSGFAWYRLGTTRLPSFKTPVRVEIEGSTTTDVSLDCLVLSPMAFTPNNVHQPDFIVATPIEKPKDKGKSGG
ncbi:MAG: hypothetical protein JST12_06330 [Armatimonadetes bacterium]|nr:hypothetical protein [Armatimonadota bacterium]MBS1728497.1 hypothetical protein [Armatimonadota bacterium]